VLYVRLEDVQAPIDGVLMIKSEDEDIVKCFGFLCNYYL